jgi:cell division protein FtsL
MTPPAATSRHRPASQAGRSLRHTGRALRRAAAPRAPRRISGPARPPRAALAGADTATARPPFGLRLGATAMRVGDARLLDRLVRGRAWIALVAIGLMGIVFMQVSLLKLNAGISRAVTAADTLERQNSALRSDISNLDSDERIQAVAAKLGMTTPAAGDVHYLDAREADGARAAASIKPPAPVAASTTPAPAATTAQQPAAAATQPQAQQPATAQQQPTQAAATAAAQEQPAAATQQPAASTTPASAAGGATTTTTTTAPPAATASGPAAAAGGASAPQGG